VPDEAWAKFEAMLHRARIDLEKSHRLNPKDPNSSCQLLVVARGLGLSRDEMERYFQNAISAFPFHYNSHYEKLNYLMPKWHGTQQEMNDFAMECMKSSNKHPYLGLVTIAALEESHYQSPRNKYYFFRSKSYLGRDDVWPTVEKMYEKFFVKYPEDIRRRFFYAYDACLARKFDVAIKQFEIIGDRWTEGTQWDSLNEYYRWRADAYAIHATGLPPEQAMVARKKAVELDPFRTDFCLKLGAAAAKLRRHDEAEAAYLKVLDINPSCAEAHLLLCQIYEKTNDLAQAKYHAEKALQCNPTDQQKKTAKNYIDASNKGLK
jgi:tetratricopeptide (TPR) repeat protein